MELTDIFVPSGAHHQIILAVPFSRGSDWLSVYIQMFSEALMKCMKFKKKAQPPHLS